MGLIPNYWQGWRTSAIKLGDIVSVVKQRITTKNNHKSNARRDRGTEQA